MLKKFVLFITILTTSLFSFQLDMWQEENNAVLNFNIDYDNVGGDEGTNWVAIYKAGDSNDWDNVITWAWATDLTHNEAGNYDERILPLVTDAGNYEVRFFLNNSYDVFATYAYSNGGGNNHSSIGIADQNDNAVIFNSTIANKTWIGIYHLGDSNDWDNVKAWSWVNGASTTIDISNLNAGDYEARLFYNNSYTVETTVDFSIEGINLTEIITNYISEHGDTGEKFGHLVNIPNNKKSAIVLSSSYRYSYISIYEIDNDNKPTRHRVESVYHGEDFHVKLLDGGTFQYTTRGAGGRPVLVIYDYINKIEISRVEG